ncbi:MAG: AGE family epimerase/isomerase [Sphaerochaetaceae bacterium]|nr:AGE family epimerase/isomerase [Sphaerochaetaceae bacterium]
MEYEKKVLKENLELYRKTLFDGVIPFWINYSLDLKNGGYYTCLDEDGTVYDTDKFTWMQAREIWCFSHIYNRYGEKYKYLLDAAKLGIDFLLKNLVSKNGDFYFSSDEKGNPLIAPYNIYSDCFACMAIAEYGFAINDNSYLDLSKKIYANIQKRKDNPKGKYNKAEENERKFHSFGFSMIQVNLAQVLKRFDDNPFYDQMIFNETKLIIENHIDEKQKIVFERVSLDKKRYNCMENRLLCPGHTCELIWFLAKSAKDNNDIQLIDLLSRALLWTLERGWDEKYGGIFYYQDSEGFPTEKVESNMKLWWVHVEALYATLYLYSLTKNEELFNWYVKIHSWSFSHFNDDKYGEWYGYLERDGSLAKTMKGGKWKGMFHLPRALIESISTIEYLLLEDL